MDLGDCALAGPGLAFAMCLSRLRELDAARARRPAVACSPPADTAFGKKTVIEPTPSQSPELNCAPSDSVFRK
jgi:hypothetical protein